MRREPLPLAPQEPRHAAPRQPPPRRPAAGGRARGPARALLLTTGPGAPPAPLAAAPGGEWVAAGCCALETAPPATLDALIAEWGIRRLVVLLSEHAPLALRDSILALPETGLPVTILPWSPPVRGGAPKAPEEFAAPLTARAARAKRALDLALGIPVLALLLPLMAVIACVIRRDSPGPALFRQQRIGQGGRPFQMYKFRTMYHQPEAAEAALRAAAPEGPPAPGHDYKLPDDPRITRAGRFLRRSSLDELPQFLNVVRGDMSLVGPRPEIPGIVRRYATWQLARLAVPPGVTGWWQVTGRSNHPMHLSTDADLYYLHHYSFALDLRILARTLAVVVRGTGAY